MSQDYRYYDDHWRTDPNVVDEPLDVSAEFNETELIMREISAMIHQQRIPHAEIEKLVMIEMAKAVFGSNNIDRLGIGLDETMKLCLAVFQDGNDLEIPERSVEYQRRLDTYVLKSTNPGEKAVIRSRSEVVQHAAAFQHLVNAFVKHDRPITEQLIKETHAILVKDLSAQDAGALSSSNSYGGTYRRHEVYAGAIAYASASEVGKAMRAMVTSLQEDTDQINQSGTIDPFMIAAKYCDRFVNIHPFQDGNGRMCRLILNAILIKYSGVVIALGEKSEDRDEYLMIAQESTKVGGHAGHLGRMVLQKAGKTLKGLKSLLPRK
ncbi:MAG: hypothetical protein Q9196_003437 [Gyalolechia fulgens]